MASPTGRLLNARTARSGWCLKVNGRVFKGNVEELLKTLRDQVGPLVVGDETLMATVRRNSQGFAGGCVRSGDLGYGTSPQAKRLSLDRRLPHRKVCQDIVRASSRTSSGGDTYTAMAALLLRPSQGDLLTPSRAESEPIGISVDGSKGEVVITVENRCVSEARSLPGPRRVLMLMLSSAAGTHSRVSCVGAAETSDDVPVVLQLAVLSVVTWAGFSRAGTMPLTASRR